MKFQSSLRNLRRGSGQAAPTFRTHAEAGQFIGVQPVPSGRLKAGAWVPAPLSDGNRRHHGAGRAYLFPDGRGGCVVNWVTGERAFWFDDYGRPLSKEEHAERRRLMAEAERSARAAETKRREVAASVACELIRAAAPVQAHSYLTRKHVTPDQGLYVIDSERAAAIIRTHHPEYGPTWRPWDAKRGRPLDGALLMAPMYVFGADGWTPQTVELISEGGAKCFMRDGPTRGAVWLPLSVLEGEIPDRLAVAEGVATALSVAQGAGIPCVAAMSCANLAPAAASLRECYPEIDLTVCGDLGNGADEAARAALSIRPAARIAFPEFTADLRDRFKALTGSTSEPTDFNDYYLAKGVL